MKKPRIGIAGDLPLMSEFVAKSIKSNNGEEGSVFLECAELILPWLTPLELANVSLTSKAFYQISKTITLSRSIDSSRGLENLAIPFHNTVDTHPYAFFIYTPTLILPSVSRLVRQSWGSKFAASPNYVGELAVETVSLVDERGEKVCGCDCDACGHEGSECPCSSLAGLDVATECGPSCGCELDCGNRLSQTGISVRLKIVRDKRKGWGLYADQLIKKGQFVCEYAGNSSLQLKRKHSHLHCSVLFISMLLFDVYFCSSVEPKE